MTSPKGTSPAMLIKLLNKCWISLKISECWDTKKVDSGVSKTFNEILTKFYLESPTTIDFIEAEILKYFYSTLLGLAWEQDVLVPLLKKIRNHIFQRNLMYSSDLRRYLLEIIAKYEIQYF